MMKLKKGGDISRPRGSKTTTLKAQRSRKKKNTNTNSVSSNNSKKSKTSLKRKERKESASRGEAKISQRTESRSVDSWGAMDAMSASEAFSIIYGFKPNVVYGSEHLSKPIITTNARDWWEHSSPTTQCANAINPIIYGQTECYICGEKLLKEEQTPECEHILPIYKAAQYLTLYRHEYKQIMVKGLRGENLSSGEARIFKEITMEYDWSHRCCNQKKSDEDFMKFNQQTGKFVLDAPSTTNVLKKIIKGSIDTDGHCKEKSLNSLFYKIKSNGQKGINDWIKNRIDILQDSGKISGTKGKVREITDYLNNIDARISQNMTNLVHLCNIISAADMDKVHTIWNEIAGNAPIKNFPPIVQITKASILQEITKFSNEKVSKFDWGRTRTYNSELAQAMKYVFGIPENIQISIHNSREMMAAILGSSLNVITTNEAISDFFVIFHSINCCYKPSSGSNPLFSGTSTDEKIGQIYSSNMCGTAFMILYYTIIVKNIEVQINKDENEKFAASLINFKTVFENEINDLFVKMKEHYNNYIEEAKLSNEDKNSIYYQFILLFFHLSKGMSFYNDASDDNIQDLLKIQIDKFHSENNLLLLDDLKTSAYNEFMKSNDYFNDKIKENSVILFVLNESDGVKDFPEFNPNESSTNSTFMKSVKNVAYASNALLQMKKREIDDLLYVEEIGNAIGKADDLHFIDYMYKIDPKQVKSIIITQYNEGYPKNKTEFVFDDDWLKYVSAMKSEYIENIKQNLQTNSQPFIENKESQNNVKTNIINEMFEIIEDNQIESQLLTTLLQSTLEDIDASTLSVDELRNKLMSFDILSLDELVEALNNIKEIVEAANILLSLKMDKNNMDVNNNMSLITTKTNDTINTANTANTNEETLLSNLTDSNMNMDNVNNTNNMSIVSNITNATNATNMTNTESTNENDIAKTLLSLSKSTSKPKMKRSRNNRNNNNSINGTRKRTK